MLVIMRGRYRNICDINGNADSTYEFYIRSLQPNEKVWIGPALLLKPMKDEIEITYILRSDKTDGTISGQLLIRN